MKRLPWFLALAALALAAWFGFGARGDRSEARRLRAANDSLRAVARRVDSVYVRDTLTLWRLARATDTLTATVEVWKRDTLRVVEYVERADSTIRACAATVATCEERVRVRDARLAVLDSLNRDTERRLRAERGKRLRDALAGVGVGALAVTLLRP